MNPLARPCWKGGKEVLNVVLRDWMKYKQHTVSVLDN